MAILQTEFQTELSLEELRGFIGRERDARQLRKALAVKLSYEGYSYESISQILEVSMGAITQWKRSYEEEGLGGFRPRHKGRKSYLSAESRAEIQEWLQTKEIWELSELESYLAETYDVVYESKQSYYDLFKEGGVSWKKTSKVNPKSDEAAVAAKKQKSSQFWVATGSQ